MFDSFIDYPPCDECGSWRCEQSHTLTAKGKLMAGPCNDGGIMWPQCPRKYDLHYEYGQEQLDLAQLCEWLIERDGHKDTNLTAGGARLCREYLRIRSLPKIIAENAAHGDTP